MKRRSFITRSLGGSIFLAVFGGGVLAVRRGTYPDVGARELRVLDQATFWILAAVAQITTPANAALSADVAYGVEQALWRASPRVQREFQQVLYLLENALPGLFFRGSTTVFTRMTAVQQRKALSAWRDSRLAILRGGYQGLRKLTLSAYYCDPSRAQEVGYPGPRFAVPEGPKLTDITPISPPFVVQKPAGSAPTEQRPAQPATGQPPREAAPEEASP